jgi:hypothetical protein
VAEGSLWLNMAYTIPAKQKKSYYSTTVCTVQYCSESCRPYLGFAASSAAGPNGKHYLSPASYSLIVEEKKIFCQCLRGVRVPTGFSSNITKLVSVKDLSMSGYNSHDCHMMMMVFLAIAIRAIKSMHIKVLITHLCYFFNTVSQKVIGHKELDALKAYMMETMCMLEMCFPPFFDL